MILNDKNTNLFILRKDKRLIVFWLNVHFNIGLGFTL